MSIILPNHEQIFPTLLLPTRLEEYILPGQQPTQRRAYAKFVTGWEAYNSIVAAQNSLNIHSIDPRYFVGTLFHESGCSNEVDTEIATQSSPHGFVSVGAYQIGQDEAFRYGYQLTDMLDLSKASLCMVRLANDNLTSIKKYVDQATFGGKQSTFDYTDQTGKKWVDGGLRAYAAIAHNHGLGYTRTTILNYGLDWARYKERNPHDHIVDHSYGSDCITGGPQYPSGAGQEVK